ncbi:hypothetical protein NP493_593g01045 [Ridgeia piscesae]|uniref:SH2 domain-containing adapter protein D n=1 Tax=Ridgeia piscesae TaxID=27915 RepID=A0AAD9KVJ9_RIDPI|nr:hypothetical protein NP493_593g01045 [Ridgeia piscesae]
MAKLLKHLGFGSKKGAPQPPKVDYGAQKSSSVQELLPRSPASERSSMCLPAAGSHAGDFETASMVSSPSRMCSGAASSDKYATYGGARQKEPSSSSVSPKSGCERHASTGATTEDPHSGGGSENESSTGPPPPLLDEYSDPFDLKKQIAENTELLGACASVPLAEDDYSVPYEVKKLMQGQAEMKLLEQSECGPASPSRHSLRQDDTMSTPTRYAHEVSDLRPREDYDEPWEWSVKQSALLQAQLHQSTNQNASPTSGGQRGSVPLMLIRKSATADGTKERLAPKAEVEEDDEGYTHLREEFGLAGPPKPKDSSASCSTKAPVIGNYDEPWDLTSTQRELEDKIKAASGHSSNKDQPQKSSSGNPTRPAPPGQKSDVQTADGYEKPWDWKPDKKDDRTQEGYEKPWDWKPHKKDDRTQEGYEKPWDWKPHQKDDRPPDEYEAPWDQKAKQLEKDILKKAVTSCGSRDCAKVGGRPSEGDVRPPEEYDEPWDQKLKNRSLLTHADSESNAMSNQSQRSPKKIHKMNLDLARTGSAGHTSPSWNSPAEKIDPLLPLEQQGWYHGSISRVNAEQLLRVHKEGSYLVRMSESNKLDFSLSLKSARGFMHMKIVNRDGRFILGQFSQPFSSIPKMIHHYTVSKLPIKGAEHMSLLHPIINETL